VRDFLLPLLPHAVAPGLLAIGNPPPDAPVLVTGNYTLTVRRLLHVLRGRDAWLLVANSHGINVWCAAGGGHFTHHDVIAAVRATGLAEKLESRRLVLPQLAATGVERRKIADATGFQTTWGPARLEDLPEYLERGYRLKNVFRTMRFPAWERALLALTWALPMAAIAAFVLGFAQGWRASLAGFMSVVASVVVLFLAIPWVVVTGWKRVFTYATFALMGFGAAALLAERLGAPVLGTPLFWWLLATHVAAMAVCSLDLAGTTPIHPSSINTLGNQFDIELVEDRCTGATDCVQVCPRGVLAMDGTKRKVRIVRPDDCIRCGACIVQCPEDAIQFRFRDGQVVEPATVRSTRMNMLGRRTVKLSSE
jgi:NAD-dependent dihydropyrimidine dehydrogenase PreA subunit